MRIHVTETHHGSTTGRNDLLFEAGQTYEMPEALGEVFVSEGWGREVLEENVLPEATDRAEPDTDEPQADPVRKATRGRSVRPAKE